LYRLLRVFALSVALLSGPASAFGAASSGSGGAAADLRGPGGLSDGSAHARQRLLSVWVGFPYAYYGWGRVGLPLGIGLSYFQPLLHDGFVPNLNDSFNLEAGAHLAFAWYGGFSTWLAVPVTVNWMLHFTPRFSGYLKAGAAIHFTFGYWAAQHAGAWVGAFPAAGVGVMFKLNHQLTLRLEAGYPWLALGLGFAF
jgi:hypothetical protein